NHPDQIAQWWTTISTLAVTGVAVTWFALQLCKPHNVCRKAFLVVDDLDRCEPIQMIAVIESIRLFLDQGTMSKRLQVAMLLDKTVLENGLINRGRDWKILPDTRHGAAFARMQREKFFAAELT